MIKKLEAAAYELLQTLLGLVGLFFHYLGKVLHEIHPSHIAQRIQKGPYYWACQRKRRARGQDEWQEIDLALGIWPPEGHPFRESMIGISPDLPLFPVAPRVVGKDETDV